MAREHRRRPRTRARRGWKIGAAALITGVVVIGVALAALQVLPAPASDELAGADEITPTDTVVPSSQSATYVEADVGFPGTLNPLLAESDSEEAVATLLYRGLTQIDARGDPQPDLARDWSVSDDGLEYTVELDQDATWHDGDSVTVEDVLFTISLVQDPDFPGESSLARFWRAITVEQVDQDTMRFELLEAYSGFPHYLTLPILPRHEFGGILPADLEDGDLDWGEVGTGPYMLDEVNETSGEIRLAARDDGDASPDLDTVVFRYFDSRDEANQAFRDGEVDGLAYVPVDALTSNESALPSDARVYAPSLSGYTALYFNVRHPQFHDAATRRAIEHAIDREAIVESVLGGQAVPGSSPIPEMLSAHQPGDHASYSPDRALELLEEAGWQSDDEEVLHRDGERFIVSLVVNGDDEQRMAVASLIEEQLRAVGIAVDIQALPADEVQQAIDSRQFGAALYGWHTENGDPDCYQLWHSSQAEEGMNFTGFADSEADEHLVNARHAVTMEERNQHYAGFQAVFAEQVPAVVVFYPRYHFAVSAGIDGAEPRPLVDPSDRVRQIPTWTLRNAEREGADNQ